MQRIEALIEKLRTQFNNKAALSQLLITTQMIQREINGEMKEMAVLGNSNVAVFVPNMPSVNKGIIVKDKYGGEKEYFQLDGMGEDEADEEELRLLELQYQAGLYTNNEKEAPLNKDKVTEDDFKVNGFNPLVEVPTLFQQIRGRSVANIKTPDLIPETEEEATKTPEIINNLTTDISDTDRVGFVKNLFRGDEVMYRRSIKTIDNFNTLEEAEYWVKRELKTKLGWINNKEVAYFDRLIYRRFARI